MGSWAPENYIEILTAMKKGGHLEDPNIDVTLAFKNIWNKRVTMNCPRKESICGPLRTNQCKDNVKGGCIFCASITDYVLSQDV